MRKPADKLQQMRDEAARITKREEERLIRTARNAGYFDRRVTTPELEEVIKQGLEALPVKFSQLHKLKDKIAMAQHRISTQDRKLDTRRKILLGAFLMAQVKHRPEEFDWVPHELEKFLNTHTSDKIAVSNKEALADWLKGEPK